MIGKQNKKFLSYKSNAVVRENLVKGASGMNIFTKEDMIVCI